LRIVSKNCLCASLSIVALAVAVAGCGGDNDSSVSSGASPLDTGKTNPGEERSGTPAANEPTTRNPSHVGVSSIIVPGNPKKAIPGAIEAVLAPHPPGSASAQTACGVFVTDRYVETTYGTRQGCVRALVPGSAAGSVEVSRVVVSGDHATARAIPRGGPSDGETIAVKLVRERSFWKVDSLRSNAPVGP
jgi:hypothetical protein